MVLKKLLSSKAIFEDEHGRYPAGTWTRSPHLSQHQPFRRENCLIFVKVGYPTEMDR
jgi:anti-sigma factor ChrR (cupin superfamily)